MTIASSVPATIDSVRPETITILEPVVGTLRFDALVAGDPGEARQGRLVIFLHGFPETADAYRSILPAVARAGYFAVAFSQRGYSPGARPSAVNAYNILDLVGDVTRVAASLGGPTFHLVGHDWGGAVAWVTASLHPNVVTSLTVLSTPNPNSLSAGIADFRNPQHAASSYMAGLRAPGSQNRLLSRGIEGFKTLFALGGGPIPAKDIDAYARVLATPDALGAAIDWYRANPLPSPVVGPVRVPTVYLWGSSDAVFLRSTAVASATYVAAPYLFCILAGHGHWLPEEAANKIEAVLLPQLARLQPHCEQLSGTSGAR